eukprot:g60436.t1
MEEIHDFLRSSRPDVRLRAAEICAGLSARDQNHQLFVGELIQTLCRLTTDRKEVGTMSLKTLVNLSREPSKRSIMLAAGMIGVLMNLLKEIERNGELESMLLANLSRAKNGAASLMQQGTEMEGRHVIWLIDKFVAPIPKDKPDKYKYLSHVLTNVSQLDSGRKLLMDPNRGCWTKLRGQLEISDEDRMLGVLYAIRNCTMDKSNQKTLLSDECGLYWRILLPILGPEKLKQEEENALVPEVRARLSRSVRRALSDDVRRAVVEIMLLCAPFKETRAYLKSTGLYYLMREQHKFEEAKGNQEIASKIEDLVDYLQGEEPSDPQAYKVKEPKEILPSAPSLGESKENSACAPFADASKDIQQDTKHDEMQVADVQVTQNVISAVEDGQTAKHKKARSPAKKKRKHKQKTSRKSKEKPQESERTAQKPPTQESNDEEDDMPPLRDIS